MRLRGQKNTVAFVVCCCCAVLGVVCITCHGGTASSALLRPPSRVIALEAAPFILDGQATIAKIMFIELDLAFSALIYVSRATKYLKSILKH